MKKYALLIAMLICELSSVFAAEKGSFDTQVSFNSADRPIACYVTEDYSEETPADLFICLHGAGDTHSNYRNALFQTLRWDTLRANTVYVCPDGGEDYYSDFYDPQNDEQFIDSVIAWAKSEYNIADDKIYLQGFSLGGRSALKYALDRQGEFAGLLLHTPAIQSIMDAQNNPDYSLVYDYSACGDMPIAISVGLADTGFDGTVKVLADSLILNNAHLIYIPIPDFPHSVPPNSINKSMFNYLEKPITKLVPLLHDVIAPAITYDNNGIIYARVRNMGNIPLTKLSFKYTASGNTKTYDWTGNIASDAYEDIEIFVGKFEQGAYQVSNIFICSVNDEAYSEDVIFNSGSCELHVFNESRAIPFVEDFVTIENIDNNWSLKKSGYFQTWTLVGDGNGNDNSMLMINSILQGMSSFGLTEELLTNRYDLDKAEIPAISFDLAFNYFTHDEPYFTEMTTFTDTLEVLMSNDNWETSVSIFKKWGDDLQTYEEVFHNPETINSVLGSPTSDQWKTTEIDLSDYEVSDKTMFSFNCISGSGGVLFMDNFKVFDKADVSVKEIKPSMFDVYPNPATHGDMITVTAEYETAGKLSVELYNYSGKLLKSVLSRNVAQGTNSFSFMTPDLTAGAYILKMKIGNQEYNSKMIIK